MKSLPWFLISFFCGSLPFSVWIGRGALKVDIRQYGDKNPGTANVFRAGGRMWGVAALLLDFLKGAVPVGLAHWVYGLSGWELALVALAPVLGHAYSPFLGFHGGKALAVTFGVWTGLTLWLGPVIFGANLAVWSAVLAPEGWVVLIGGVCFVGVLLAINAPVSIVVAGMLNVCLLAWKYRADLKNKPVMRSWLTRLIKST